jgi:hypothetical protein
VDLPLEGGQIVPLVLNDAAHGFANERGPRWPTGKPREGRMTIGVDGDPQGQKDRLTVSFNGERILEWEGALKSISKRGEEHPAFPSQPLASLFCISGGYEFTDWTLRILDGQATVLREKPTGK